MCRKVILFGIAILLQPVAAWAGSDVIIGTNASSTQLVSMAQIDHTGWDQLLRKYCDEQGFVNYQAWHRSGQDRQLLQNYLAHLSTANPNQSAPPAAKMAFWINAYNAVTIHGILREYPTTSIRNHTAKVFGYNIWDDLLLPVGSQNFSLNQMEHEVLRKMGDPRVHFAIVCASIGCPPLLNAAYSPQTLDAQLTANAQRFFADREKFRYDAAQRKIELSPIIKWFAEDFGANQTAQLQAIAPFLPDQTSKTLAASGQASVGYLDYDWNLNDQATRVARQR